ncbi:MAG: hypothetical protein EHM48_09325 [Planctomycetaceae bacterium]|nr:MAG: hypothetical protein EHM48_09325 [Planctomycetaceae bacterium]
MKFAGLCFVLATTAMLAGCGDNLTVAGAGKTVEIDHNSSTLLLVTLDEAIAKKDYNAIVQSMTPDLRPSFKTIAKAYKEYIDNLNSLADITEQKIGAEQAKMFRDRAKAVYAGLIPSPLEGAIADNTVDWNKVKLLDEGDVTAVTIVDHNSQFDKMFVIEDVKGRWYILPRFTHIPPEQWKKLYADDAKQEEKTMREYVRITKDLREQVRRGKLNKSNFDEKMSAMRNTSNKPKE